MLTDLYTANGFAPCDCQASTVTVEMRTTAGLEVSGYPVKVFDINQVELGIAHDKTEYISIWNSSAANTGAGMLSGNAGPFRFRFMLNAGPVPTFVFGNPLIDAGADDNIITEDLSGNEDIVQEDDQEIVTE